MDPASREGTHPHLARPSQTQEYRSLSAIQQTQAEQLVALSTLVHALTNPGQREPHLATPAPTMGRSPTAVSS